MFASEAHRTIFLIGLVTILLQTFFLTQEVAQEQFCPIERAIGEKLLTLQWQKITPVKYRLKFLGCTLLAHWQDTDK